MIYIGSGNDNYRTPKYAWEMIQHLIPKDKTIYEPFYCKGASSTYWKEMGYNNIIHNDEDFYTNCEERIKQCDYIISNPPYSTKKNVFIKLKELDKPFIMLVPLETIGMKYFIDNYKNQFQMLIPPNRIYFTKMIDENGDDIDKLCGSPFHVVFICYKMNFEKDMMYL